MLPLTDWVGFDVKAHIAQYAAITDVPGSGVPAWRSLALLMQSGVSHELRTTYHPHLHDDAQMQQLAPDAAGSGRTGMGDSGASSPAPDTHEKLGRIRRHVPEALLLAHLRSTGFARTAAINRSSDAPKHQPALPSTRGKPYQRP